MAPPSERLVRRPKTSICLPVQTLLRPSPTTIGAAGRRRQAPATGGAVALATDRPAAGLGPDSARAAAGATTRMKARAKRNRRAGELPREGARIRGPVPRACRRQMKTPCNAGFLLDGDDRGQDG